MRLLEPAVAAVSNQKIDTILNTGYFDTTFIQFHQLIGLNDWKLRVGSPILRLFHNSLRGGTAQSERSHYDCLDEGRILGSWSISWQFAPRREKWAS